MMLDWLGHPAAARRIEQAVERVFAAGNRTRDLGGTLDTAGFVGCVVAELKSA